MDLQLILELAAFIIINAGILLAAWINIKVKIKEIEIRMLNVENDVKENKLEFHKHESWGIQVLKDEKLLSDARFEKLEKSNNESHEKLLNKLDTLIDRLTQFQIYVEKKFKA